MTPLRLPQVGRWLAGANWPAHAWCPLLICACFTLSSEAWIQWHQHLIQLMGATGADAAALVGGYLAQAAGMLVGALVLRRHTGRFSAPTLVALVVAHYACSLPASLGTSLTVALTFGLLTNILCGMLSAGYLQALAQLVRTERRGIAFGSAYAVSAGISWLLSFAGGVVAHEISALGGGALLGALTVVVALLPIAPREEPDKSSGTTTATWSGMPTTRTDTEVAGGRPTPTKSDGDQSPLALAALTVLLMSLVKNVGFSFPSTDFVVGVSVEASRLFYAAGLVVAGVASDRHRHYGALLCLATLALPFAQLALSGEPIPATLLWAVDYFFFGFFSIYRVVLFADLAAERAEPWLAGLGLCFGRIGDASGTALCLSLQGSTMALVLIAMALFALTVFVALQLYQRRYLLPLAPVQPRRKSERELFDAFASRHALSQREREVLRQVLGEHTNAEIAAALFVTESTVKFHVRNLLRKTGCKNRLELMACYASERENG